MCVGATTLDEYRQYIEKDAALERRFQKVFAYSARYACLSPPEIRGDNPDGPQAQERVEANRLATTINQASVSTIISRKM
ncbi:hypothetical protein FK513_31345, partial [Klebsiella pneumoniae]|nr:hypothetical protein [Klebsiella pneumoniae]